MNIDTAFLRRCIASLERAVEGIGRHEADDDVMYDIYRDNRNHTAHDYGEDFAESTLRLLPVFIHDARALADVIEGVEG